MNNNKDNVLYPSIGHDHLNCKHLMCQAETLKERIFWRERRDARIIAQRKAEFENVSRKH